MTEAKSNPKWKRASRLALKIYAGVCTVLVTAYLPLVLWSIFFAKPSLENSETMIMASYGQYVAKEYPKRADYFSRLAGSLNMHSEEVSVRADDMLKYLGKPDLIAGTVDTGMLVYFYDHPGATNRWAVYAALKDGKLTDIGFNDATVNDHSAYEPYTR